MAGRELRGVGVVQVGDLLVPVRVPGAQVRPRDERLLAAHFEPSLEDVGAIALLRVRIAIVDEEHRHGACVRRDPPVDPGGGQRSLQDVQLKPVGVGHRDHARNRRAAAQRHLDRPLLRSSLPHTPRAAPALAVRLAVLVGCLLADGVVAPSDRHADGGHAGGDERAQPERRREVAPLRRCAVLSAIVGRVVLLRLVDLLVAVNVTGLLLGRPHRDQEASQVPVRWPFPAWQPLLGQRVSWPGADEIQLERLDQPVSNPERRRRSASLWGRSLHQNSAGPVVARGLLAVRPAPGARAARSSPAEAPERCSSAARSAFNLISRASTSSRTSSGQR